MQKQSKKRIGAIALCVAMGGQMILSGCHSSADTGGTPPVEKHAEAAQNDVQEKNPDLAKYILKAKKLFGISDAYDRVDGSIDDDVVHIRWDSEKTDADVPMAIVQMTRSEDVLSFDRSTYSDAYLREKVDAKTAAEKALTLAQSVYSDSAAVFRVESQWTSGNIHRIQLRMFWNDHPVWNGTVLVSIHKSTGALEQFQATREVVELLHYSQTIAKPTLTKDQAMAALREKNPLTLVLQRDNTDDKHPHYTAFYRMLKRARGIDAKSGDLVVLPRSFQDASDGFKSESAANAKQGHLTPAEEAERKAIQNLKPKDQALARAQAAFGLKPEDKIRDGLGRPNSAEPHEYSFLYKANNVQSHAGIRATDLTPMDYWTDTSEDGDISEDAVMRQKKAAEDFVRTYIPDPKRYHFADDDWDTAAGTSPIVSFHFYRDVEGFLLLDDAISFSYDERRLTSYSYTAVSPEIAFDHEVIPLKEAEAALEKAYPITLYAVPHLENNRIQSVDLAYGYAVGAPSLRAKDGVAEVFDERSLFWPSGDSPYAKEIDDLRAYGFGTATPKRFSDAFTRADFDANLDVLSPRAIPYHSRLVEKTFEDDTPLTMRDFLVKLVYVRTGLSEKTLRPDLFSAEIAKGYPESMRGALALALGMGLVTPEELEADLLSSGRFSVDTAMRIYARLVFSAEEADAR